MEFMRLALQQAELALSHGEIPVGCVFVQRETNRVIAKGSNKTNETRNGTAHAELVAISDAIFSDHLDPAIFKGCDLYVTCEPCIMCAAAIGKIGVGRVYFGCHNDRFGGNGSILSVHSGDIPSLQPYEVTSGLLKEETIEIFQRFYSSENRRAPESKRKRKPSLQQDNTTNDQPQSS